MAGTTYRPLIGTEQVELSAATRAGDSSAVLARALDILTELTKQ